MSASSSSQEQQLLKLDSVLSAEQVRALFQEAAQAPHNDKLDFDVLGSVAGTEDGNHSLAAIDDSFHDLENLVLGQGPASGSLFAESEAEVEALLKATLGADDLLSPIDLVLLDHCYCTPLTQLVAGAPTSSSLAGGGRAVTTPLGGMGGQPLAQGTPPATMQETDLDRASPQDEQDGDDAGLASPGSPQQPLRRSQRQIERIDRERLERIKAENAEQKRREQEEMVGRCTPVLGAESPQAPPPVTSSLNSPLMSPVPTATTSPQMASPQPHQQQEQQQQQPAPTSMQTSPATHKEKAHAVAAPPLQQSPVRRGKVRNSESTSSTEGPPEDVGAIVNPTRPRKKRSREEAEHTEGPKKGPTPRKAGLEGVGPKSRREGTVHRKLSRTEEDTVLAAREEQHLHPVRRKSDDTDAKKRKHTPEPVSPFGKVVKVVRTMPEPKKRPRRESFTDEPALFSQPDVLHKEHEPQAVSVTTAAAVGHIPASTASSMTPVAAASTPKPSLQQHSEESVYDSVEAHVARLAGGVEHGHMPATVPPPVATAPTTPAIATVPTGQVTGVTVPQHKPNIGKHGHAETNPLPKKLVTAKLPLKLSQPDHKKPALAVAVKSAPPPPSPAKVKHAGHHGTLPPKTPKLSKGSAKTPQGKSPGLARKTEPHAHPRKVPKQELPTVAVAAPVAASPAVVVTERPKRQSKEKFKRAMMRKREMGRRVDDEDVEDSPEDAHDSEWSSEDDPERLWCICRKPHNDKFMIECDRCKDWFHGTCVGVTRQQGRLLEKENKEWVCPKCSKGESHGAPARKELHRQLSDEKAYAKVRKPTAPKVTHQSKPATEEQGTPPGAPAAKPDALAPKVVVRECLVCKRKAECIGLYCGRSCIAKYVHDANQTIKAAKLDGERRLMFTERSSGKLVAGVQTPTAENLTNWLVRNPTYELAVARTPARPPSAKHQASKPTQHKQAPQPKPAKPPISSTNQPQSTMSSSGANVIAAAAAPAGATNSTPADGTGTAEAGGEAKKAEVTQASIEPVRLNVRKVLRDALLNRCKEATDLTLPADEVRRMAVRIEEELFKFFRDTGTRYKSKYRSLVFNIKDSRNQGLFRKILRGKIPPDRLVRMTPEELASKELARWREQENKHTIEMIKKEQMEAAQNVSSHALLKKTHKGEVEIDDDNLRLLEKADEKAVSEQPEQPATAQRAPSVGSTTTSIETAERSGKDTTDAHRSHLFDLNCKICTGKVAPPPDERLTPSPPPSRRSSTASMPAQPSGNLPVLADELSSSSASSTSPPPPPPPARERGSTPPPPVDRHKSSHRPREDSSDLEPSSTVSLGSPDSGSGSKGKQPQLSSVWKGFISMQEVSKFVTAAYKVSGPTDFLSQQDIPDTINVCGRIIPDQVWDYLSKIKQSGNKELLVVRFQPANEEERRPYRELYMYLNSRKRCGVVGGLSPMLKDFYILPLPSHSPVPTVLMPFDGPGLASGRPHMLLGIIVRHKNRSRASTVKSKSSWSERPEAVSLTPPLPETPSGGTAHSDDEEPYEPSYTPPLEKRPRHARPQQASSAAAERTPVADDEDVPYDPEENEVGIAGTPYSAEPPPPPPPPRVSGQAVSELIERISAGANPAAVTTSVLASFATNVNLEHQKRLLVELTQEVEEQKRLIELQRLQAIQMSMSKPSTPPPTPAVSHAPPATEASGIPFLDSSLPTDTGLSFLSGAGASSGSCSLPSSLQELLNKVKVPQGPSAGVGDVLGSLLAPASLPAIGSPQQQQAQQSPLAATKKTLTEDPIVRHFAGDGATPESDPEGGGSPPPPPGIGDVTPPGLLLAGAAASRSPGTPTKDELVIEEAGRPQDPRRRKVATATSSPGPPAAALSPASTGGGSQLGTKSASELMEMARKQLEELEAPPLAVHPTPQPSSVVAPPAMYTAPPMPPPAGMPPSTGIPPPAGMPPPTGMPPPPAGMAPPPTVNLVPPPPPAAMYGPPPSVDAGFAPPPGVMPPGVVPPGYPPPPQWGAADPYWKGPPLPPPQSGWNGGRGGDYRQQGGPGWRGGRRNQWDH